MPLGFAQLQALYHHPPFCVSAQFTLDPSLSASLVVNCMLLLRNREQSLSAHPSIVHLPGGTLPCILYRSVSIFPCVIMITFCSYYLTEGTHSLSPVVSLGLPRHEGLNNSISLLLYNLWQNCAFQSLTKGHSF